MPGYMIHLAEGNRILEYLAKDGILTAPADRRRFLLGCLLPDTRRKKEKETSHFWNPKELWKLALAPDLAIFDARYRTEPDDPGLLGYRVHLQLDQRYVAEFWPRTVEFLDEEGNAQEAENRIRQVLLKRSGERIPVQEYFSERYYYGDYTRMNSWLAEEYDIAVPEYCAGDWLDFPVTEVETEDLMLVLRELEKLLSVDTSGMEDELRVFDRKELMRFIEGCAEDAANLICRQVKNRMIE